jgi:hypothetical protein
VLSSDIVLFSGNSPAGGGGGVTQATSAIAGFKTCSAISIIAAIRGGAGGVLDVYIQDSPDGVRFYDYAHFTQLTAAAALIVHAYSPSPFDNTIKTIGTDLTPALAANSARGGHWYDQLRVLFVAGAGVAVAAQDIRLLAVR